MKALSRLTLTAVSLAMAGTVAAQRIEISSPSLGTVVVTPTAVNDRGTRSVARTNAPRRTGVDLGIKRRADGSLYDALDPAQNPAAATGSTAGNANAAATGTSNVDSNPGASNALNGNSNGGFANPGSAAGATSGGAAASAGGAASGR